MIQVLDPYPTSAVICTWEVSLYCAGFPCTPFSTLNTATSLLADRNSRQLFAVISRIKLSKPKETQHNHANRHVEIRWFSFESIVYISFLDPILWFPRSICSRTWWDSREWSVLWNIFWNGISLSVLVGHSKHGSVLQHRYASKPGVDCWLRYEICFVRLNPIHGSNSLTCSKHFKTHLFVYSTCSVDQRSKFGAPISRRRIYIVLIRKDVLSDEVLHAMAASQSDDPFTDIVEKRVRSMTIPCKYNWWPGWKRRVNHPIE